MFIKLTLGLFILLIISLSSCFRMPFVSKKNIKNYSFCYHGENTGIMSLIDINGYYEIGRTPGGVYGFGTQTFKIDTNHTAFMFFNDGMFLCQFSDYHNPGNISEYFREVVKNTEMGKKDQFYQAFSWGCYIICDDTIKTQYINHPAFGSPIWMLSEEWFKVVDRNTLKSIFKQKLYGDKKILYDFRKSDGDTYTWYEENHTLFPAEFISVQVLPSSNCWLKKKKWFWCDKNQWLDYKKANIN